MFEVGINGKKTKAEVTFYTAQLYEAEFRSDLIKDLFGVQDDSSLVEFKGEEVVRIDFTQINWLATMKVLWAAVKTADDKVPSYAKWMKQTQGVNLWEVREFLSNEIVDCFFRAESAGTQEQ